MWHLCVFSFFSFFFLKIVFYSIFKIGLSVSCSLCPINFFFMLIEFFIFIPSYYIQYYNIQRRLRTKLCDMMSMLHIEIITGHAFGTKWKTSFMQIMFKMFFRSFCHIHNTLFLCREHKIRSMKILESNLSGWFIQFVRSSVYKKNYDIDSVDMWVLLVLLYFYFAKYKDKNVMKCLFYMSGISYICTVFSYLLL